MVLENLRNGHKKILNCEIKDATGLNDFQKLPDEFATSIQKVGIERFRFPVKIQTQQNETFQSFAEASMFVSLEKGKTGVNMSRFCKILQEEAESLTLGPELFDIVLKRFSLEMRDSETESPLKNTHLSIKFQYPYKQKSLVSDNWGWQYYDCLWEASKLGDSEIASDLTVALEYSSTCPCSLSMAKQYEEDYKNGKTNSGNGMAVAHSQRSTATCTITTELTKSLSVEELLMLMRTAIPTETQSLVKRVDEQAFAILNGENPMFVEHAARRLALVLDKEEGSILDWKFKIEHFESLHSHNAVAFMQKVHNPNKEESTKLH
jgi:GTP cyclohydrolase IB